MERAGYSRRRLAVELQLRRPRGGGVESWRNTVGRYLTEKNDRRQAPDDETAALLAEILDEPAATFVTPPRGAGSLRQENARLRAENTRLRRQLEEAGVESAHGPT